ncbi:MAG: 2TM domain-containing protein [Methanoregulaceae archaeon]|nr:2TM domain-containing protein [Methanoregulaceae archaeon]
MSTDEELRQIARKTAEEKSGFYIHFAIYIAVNLFLIAIWWITGGPGTFPWFVFILFGWGIGIFGHYVGVFRGHAYVERMAEREFQRMKQEEERKF